jgi:TorA maturation chaperone TorD
MDIISEKMNKAERRACADIFRILSANFYLPDKALYVEEKLFENLVSLSGPVCSNVKFHAQKMAKAFMVCPEEDLHVEYARLFVGPNELQAPPYGSVYLEEGNRVMGNTTLAVRKMYEEADLSLANDVKQPDDHISLELEFMYYMIHKELEAGEKGNREEAGQWRKQEKLFLVSYLAPWVPAFAERIRQGSENRFYTSLADCLEECVKCVIAPEEMEEAL